MKYDYKVTNFDTLFEIERKELNRACLLDLMFERKGINLIDGLLLILGSDSINDIVSVYIPQVELLKFKKSNIDYIEEKYDVRI